ncbi:Crp/Fnr family transcriptional regulator [Roseateles koreensis]|uniref:Crp/Fnr family transcriptional regulator n=1 Tax=Roseateles koreensis TaxID=2987526 RepID=A0ABT5KW20_9BURK|nr:Crp/Fnr family transcriptional regulator [Roseateles koreensis]MDC8787140.1 Crp/Fnr family transcriptional regulator [Roseateles koreensis]
MSTAPTLAVTRSKRRLNPASLSLESDGFDAVRPRGRASARGHSVDMPSAAALRATLQSAFPVEQLSEGALAALLGLGHLQGLTAKSMCLDEGQKADALYLLVQGTISVGRHDAARQWSQRRTVHAGQWVDAESAWLGGSFRECARAETQALVWAFPVAELEIAMGTQPALARALLAVSADRVQRVAGDAHELMAKNVLSRCAAWLLNELQALQAESKTDIEGSALAPAGQQIVLSQRKCAIASQLGTSPETFSRSLRQLRELQVIAIKGYRISVLNLPALIALCEADEPPNVAD